MKEFYMMSADEVVEDLGVDKGIGLDDEQIEESRLKFGSNSFERTKRESLGKRIWLASKEPMIILLIFAGIITLGINILRYFQGGATDFIECVGIFVAIGLSVFITVAMEGRSAKAFEELNKIKEGIMVKVRRNGKVQLIPQDELVVGDVLYVTTGDKLSADGRLIKTSELQVDESTLTGESMPVTKNAKEEIIDEKTPVAERINMSYSGTYVVTGSGMMIVTGVGNNTEFGKIAQELSNTDKGTTPLQEKMGRLGKTITIFGSSAAALVFIIQMFIFISNGTANLETISEAFITSIVLIVAAVPEGLPTIVAVSLSINIIKMAKEHALVKKMIACETIGCINVICSDKTGTLTENQMTVKKVYSQDRIMEPNQLEDLNMVKNFCINSTADLKIVQDRKEFIGNPTEGALLVAANSAGHNYEKEREESEVFHVFPFSSEEKDMTTIIKEDDKYTSFTKGSAEKILSRSKLSEEERSSLEKEIEKYEKEAYRVIAFAHRDFLEKPELIEAEVESQMEFDGFVAINDPLRGDVKAAVDNCKRAGIDLKILTGDNITTATAIASELNLLGKGGIAVEAKELADVSDEELKKLLPEIRVIARSTPSIKMRVVNSLKEMGDVVAVTGDGINDAPALKNADVGIAMGITGTEVSKEASDIILLDDSFTTISKAVQWGRGIYENFQRFIQFQLTVNLSSVVTVLASILLGFKSPFSALELLWINIVMDGPPALTLGLEPIRKDLMNRQPTLRNENIITKNMMNHIAINGLFISIIVLLQQSTNFLMGKPEEMSTIIFTLFVIFQLFNALNSRELGKESMLKNIHSNKLMIIVFLITFMLQFAITQFAGPLFDTVPLSLIMWLKIIGVAFSVVLLSEFAKLIKRTLNKD